MSKLDIRSAIRASGINCEFNGNPGKVLLITQEMLDTYPAADDANTPEVEAGEAIVSYRDGDRVRGEVILPGAPNDLVAVLRMADGENTYVDLGDMGSLVQTVRQVNTLDTEGASAKTLSAIAQIDAYADLAFNNVLNSRFAEPKALSNAFSYQLERSRLNANDEGGLTGEQMDKITLARALRETIGRVLPNHPDALARDDVYQSQGRALDVLSGLNTRGQDFPRAALDAMKADRRLSEEVFGAMTTTPISSLSAKVVSPEEFQAVRQAMRPGIIKGGYAAVIKGRLDDIFAKAMPGYTNKYDVQLYTKDGADLLLVEDHAGKYVYGWDTDSRVLEIGDELILGEADVPSDEEIARLQEIVADIRYETGEDVEFDMFDGTFNERNEDDILFDMGEAIDNDADDFGFGGDNDEPDNNGFVY